MGVGRLLSSSNIHVRLGETVFVWMLYVTASVYWYFWNHNPWLSENHWMVRDDHRIMVSDENDHKWWYNISWTVPPDAHEGYEKLMKCLAANPGKSTACRLFCSKEKASLLAPLQVLNPKCHPVLWHPVLPAAGSQKACHLTPMKPIKNGCSACAAAEIA